MRLQRRLLYLLLMMFPLGMYGQATGAQASPPNPTQTRNPFAVGQKLTDDGKFDEAIAFYANALQANPNAWEAYLGIGSALDLKGEYDAARSQLQKAIDTAPADRKGQALRAMAVSLAFQCNATASAKYEQQAFDLQMEKQQYTAAAGVADELARIYLECGDQTSAYKWYETGHEMALKNQKITDADKDLWAFRWENAQARIAARRGQKSEAQQHVTSAKAIIDRGTNPDQAQFVPYLVGYVALYTNCEGLSGTLEQGAAEKVQPCGDYKTAISELKEANQKDPFILVLLAQAYEKSGDRRQAMEYYRKVLQINTHNPTNAFARPLAKEKQQGGGK